MKNGNKNSCLQLILEVLRTSNKRYSKARRQGIIIIITVNTKQARRQGMYHSQRLIN